MKNIINTSFMKNKVSYAWNSSSTKTTHKDIEKMVETYIHHYNRKSIDKVLISSPIFSERFNNIHVEIFYYGKQTNTSINALSELGNGIYNVYSKTLLDKGRVSVSFTKVNYPYINASIFSQYLFYNSSANTFIHFQNSILRNFSWHGKEIQSYIKGVKIQVSGRIITEKVIPRVTSKSMVFGSLSKSDYIDYAKYTGKNYMGSFTIKVWIAIAKKNEYWK